jgi:predicted RNA-binding protein YlqC (UPF0109 family)
MPDTLHDDTNTAANSNRPPRLSLQECADIARDFVLDIYLEIVTHPDELEVRAATAEATRLTPKTVILTIFTAPQDIGLALGTRYKTLQAVQHLLECLSGRLLVRILASVDNPQKRTPGTVR